MAKNEIKETHVTLYGTQDIIPSYHGRLRIATESHRLLFPRPSLPVPPPALSIDDRSADLPRHTMLPRESLPLRRSVGTS